MATSKKSALDKNMFEAIGGAKGGSVAGTTPNSDLSQGGEAGQGGQGSGLSESPGLSPGGVAGGTEPVGHVAGAIPNSDLSKGGEAGGVGQVGQGSGLSEGPGLSPGGIAGGHVAGSQVQDPAEVEPPEEEAPIFFKVPASFKREIKICMAETDDNWKDFGYQAFADLLAKRRKKDNQAVNQTHLSS